MDCSERQLYRLAKTPSGRKLWAYMAGILEVTGMAQGKVFPLKKFLGNFKTHLDEGRIVSDGYGFRLTRTGMEYFSDRYKPDNPQRIYHAQVEAMIEGISTGRGPDEWLAIDC